MEKFINALSGRARGKGGPRLSEAVVVMLAVCAALAAFAAFAYAATGSVTGTGADITVKVGFQPSHVRVVNVETGDAMEWFSGMADDSAVKMTNAIDGTSRSVITSEGITPYAGTVNATTGQIMNAPGFVVGADANVNIVGNAIYYEVDR